MSNDYYKTAESVKEYIKLAKDVNGQELIDQLKICIPSGAKILEIGSGPGSDWEILNKDFEVIGSDFSNEFIQHLCEAYPKGRFVQLDARTLDIDETFDAIYANKVFQHLNLHQILSSIQRQLDILNPSGIICLSFWKGEGSEDFKGMKVHYHTKETIHGLFQQHFEILYLEEYKEFEKDDSILLIAKKKN